MAGTKARSGGKRRGAGRLPQVFHLSKEAARSLAVLTSHRRDLNPCLTSLEVLEDLIDQAWQELDEHYQQSAEAALEGETECLQQIRRKE